MKRTFCEWAFGGSYQMPVETRYMQDVTDFMEMNDIKYRRLGNYYLPKVGRFWIVELYSAGSVTPSVRLVESELENLRNWKEEPIGRREKDHGEK